MKNEEVGKRFIDEKIAEHWRVDESKDSFNKMLFHIKVKTNFFNFFEEAFEQLLRNRKEENLVILDLGGGVGWTSALMAKNPRVKKVFLVEPSATRRSINPYINSHFNVPHKKIEAIDGTFQDFNLNVKVDVVVMCASIHHCYDEYMPKLFSNIESCLKDPYGKNFLIPNFIKLIITYLSFIFLSPGFLKSTLLFVAMTIIIFYTFLVLVGFKKNKNFDIFSKKKIFLNDYLINFLACIFFVISMVLSVPTHSYIRYYLFIYPFIFSIFFLVFNCKNIFLISFYAILFLSIETILFRIFYYL